MRGRAYPIVVAVLSMAGPARAEIMFALSPGFFVEALTLSAEAQLIVDHVGVAAIGSGIRSPSGLLRGYSHSDRAWPGAASLLVQVRSAARQVQPFRER